jgi:hypothetical protein
MRIVHGFAAMLLAVSQIGPIMAGEAFLAQSANRKPLLDRVQALAGDTSMPAMLASPLPLSALKTASQGPSGSGVGNVSNVSQYGSNNMAVVAQAGAANQSVVTQHGSGNTVLVTQRIH